MAPTEPSIQDDDDYHRHRRRSAGTTKWLESRSIQHTVEENVRNAALAVGRSVDQNVTSLAQLSNREPRTKELEKF